jgi:hypothetical protein
MLLTYLGHQPVEAPYVFLGQRATVCFFGLLRALCVRAWADQFMANLSYKNRESKNFGTGPAVQVKASNFFIFKILYIFSFFFSSF